MNSLLKPGYVRFDGNKFVTDDTIQLTGPTGLPGPVGLPGPTGQPGYAITTEDFIQPSNSDGYVTIKVTFSSIFIAQLPISIQDVGLYIIASIPDSTHLTIINQGFTSVSPGETITSGKIVNIQGIPGDRGPTGNQGADGINAYTNTTSSFTQPSVNGGVSISVANSHWMSVGQIVYLSTGGYYSVQNVVSPTNITFINLGYTGNTGVGNSIAPGKLSPAGIRGPNIPINIQEFTFSDTWIKPTGTSSVRVVVIGGGGGGGSGCQRDVGAPMSGGSGGGGGGRSERTFTAASIDNSISITVGNGGSGGDGIVLTNTNGENGNNGGLSSFGAYLQAGAGVGGLGGSLSSTSGSAGGVGQFNGGTGGNAPVGAQGQTATHISGGSGSGGGGGGIDEFDVAYGGGNGALPTDSPGTQANGGTIPGGAGDIGTSGIDGPGLGGGGGAANVIGVGGDGGDGGFYGAGGGGGGASLNGEKSGAGGDGAAGIVIVTSYF